MESSALLPSAIAAVAGCLAAGADDDALRIVADTFDRLMRADVDAAAAAIQADPGSTGDERWDAMIAGVVERVAHHHGLRVPSWTAAPERFLTRWWFVSPYRSLHASAIVNCPPELANRGVFIHRQSLESV